MYRTHLFSTHTHTHTHTNTHTQAKLNGSYASIVGGQEGDALQDLTAGISLRLAWAAPRCPEEADASARPHTLTAHIIYSSNPSCSFFVTRAYTRIE